jgi:hypothetical protein
MPLWWLCGAQVTVNRLAVSLAEAATQGLGAGLPAASRDTGAPPGTSLHLAPGAA